MRVSICSEIVELVLLLLRELRSVRIGRVRILVEVGCVARFVCVRNVRRPDLLVEYLEPVDLREPLVSFDVLCLVLEASEPFRSIRGEELLDQVLRVGIEVLRKVDLAGENLLIDAERILIEEGSCKQNQ